MATSPGNQVLACFRKVRVVAYQQVAPLPDSLPDSAPGFIRLRFLLPKLGGLPGQLVPLTLMEPQGQKRLQAFEYRLNSGVMRFKSEHREYCRLRVGEGLPRKEAYLKVFPNATPGSANTLSGRLEAKPAIREELARLFKVYETEIAVPEEKKQHLLTREEKRGFLARVVRAKYTAIDPENPNDGDADLVEGVTHFYKGGELIRKVYKFPSKHQAIEIDNKMAGHNAPEEHNVTLSGGVMLVPVGGATLDEWEKNAVGQQEQLKREAIAI